MTRTSLLTAGGLVAAALIACGGSGPAGPAGPALGGCNGTALFSVLPVALNEFTGWVPLGQLNPPGHTMPTDHQYIYLINPDGGQTPPVRAVVSPGAVTVTGGRSTRYHELNRTDYSLTFQPCDDVKGEFGHLQSLAPGLVSSLGAFDQQCDTYSPNPGLTVTSCWSRPVAIELAAGEAVGTTGGVAGQFGLDFSLFDRRVPAISYANPSRFPVGSDHFDRFHVVPASDYFQEPALSQLRTKLGRFDGQVLRTVPPLGGTVAADVAGSAQGYWYNDGQPTYPEGPHLALAPDNVTPTTKHSFSVGLSQPGQGSGVWSFTPAASGDVNRGFGAVSADGAIRCYEGVIAGKVVLLQLVTATTLRLEVRTQTATCDAARPFGFGAGAFDYKR